MLPIPGTTADAGSPTPLSLRVSTSEVTLPATVLAGPQVLQITGYSPTGQARALSIGVVVQPTLSLFKGYRAYTGRHHTVTVRGHSAGLTEGTLLTPWYRLNGQKAFTQGRGTIEVGPDGKFRWTRAIKPRKGIGICVTDGTTNSNKVFWPKPH